MQDKSDYQTLRVSKLGEASAQEGEKELQVESSNLTTEDSLPLRYQLSNPQPSTFKNPRSHNRRNPDAWEALYLDRAIPVDPVAKAYMIRDLQNWTRNYLLIPIKLLANVLLALIMTFKRLLPFQFSAYTLMHRSAAFFLKHFVSPTVLRP